MAMIRLEDAPDTVRDIGQTAVVTKDDAEGELT
jgi:hypothetical protein